MLRTVKSSVTWKVVRRTVCVQPRLKRRESLLVYRRVENFEKQFNTVLKMQTIVHPKTLVRFFPGNS
jgi:hypothetical protein